MKIAIIGAGFTGLSAAYRLLQKGHDVTIFEKDPQPGGLAIGYKEKVWDWTLEKHYHHWFTNDKYILGLAKELNYPVITKRPKTCVYINNKNYQLDSPISWMLFPLLSFFERIRMLAVFAVLFRFNPFWKPLEKVHIVPTLEKLIGKKAYKTIWEPQLLNKYGPYISDISLVWFWARIVKRTPSLAYPKGGFLAFATFLSETLKKMNGKIHYFAQVTEIKKASKTTVTVLDKNKKKLTEEFDAVLVTLPTPHFLSITPQLPLSYKEKINTLTGIGATNMVLRLKEPLLRDDIYWLSICDTNSRIMVIVEHTNFMEKLHYNNEHIVYIGNYMPTNNPWFSADKKDLLQRYDPFLEKIHPDYKKLIIDYEVFRAPFAQPLIPVNYSKNIPSLTTPLEGIYLANIQQVYPWDRGTNYAVELGEKAAQKIIEDFNSK